MEYKVLTKEDLLKKGYSVYICIIDVSSYINITLDCLDMKKGYKYIIQDDGGYVCHNVEYPNIINKIGKYTLLKNFNKIV